MVLQGRDLRSWQGRGDPRPAWASRRATRHYLGSDDDIDAGVVLGFRQVLVEHLQVTDQRRQRTGRAARRTLPARAGRAPCNPGRAVVAPEASLTKRPYQGADWAIAAQVLAS